MKTEKITFEGSSSHTIEGRLELPDETPRAYAIYAHCFTCTKDFVTSKEVSRALSEKGIACLRFDFAGIGASEGTFEDKNFSTNVEDLVLAARYLAEEYDAPKIMVGHSLGGTAVLASACMLEDVKAVATMGSPYEPAHVSHLFDDHLETIEQDGKADVDLFGRGFVIKKQFLEDINQMDMKTKIQNLNKALLIMHSPQDTVVNVENAGKIYQAAKHPKSFISLDGADHLLMDKDDSRYAAELLSTWATRYI